MPLFKKRERYRVFNGASYKLKKGFSRRKDAKLHGEELKLTGDIIRYRVTEGDENYLLWIH